MSARDPDRTRLRKKPSSDTRGAAFAFCVLMHAADGRTRLDLIEHGLHPRMVRELAALMGMSLNELTRVLGIPATTFRRNANASKTLSTAASDRVMGLARLIGCAAVRVHETGGPSNFDAARWVANWLAEPLPALGGRCPSEFMSTRPGQGLVDDLLERAFSGVYS